MIDMIKYMSNIVNEIKQHLSEHKIRTGVPYEHISNDQYSRLKGYVCSNVSGSDIEYKRSWAKLAKAQKLNRLMKYYQKLIKDYSLDIDCQNQLKTLFYDSVNNDSLDRNNVNYNTCDGSIVKIDGLKRDINGVFYLDRGEIDKKTTTINIHFTPLSLQQFKKELRT